MTHLPNPLITHDVASHVLWAFNLGGYEAGSFTTHLVNAWQAADTTNRARLVAGWPDYAAAIQLLDEPDGVHTLRQLAAWEPTV